MQMINYYLLNTKDNRQLHCGSKNQTSTKFLNNIAILANINNFFTKNLQGVSTVHIYSLQVLIKQGSSLG